MTRLRGIAAFTMARSAPRAAMTTITEFDMTQRAIVFEFDDETGAKAVRDIFEWHQDRLDLNKRRLLKRLKDDGYSTGLHHLMIVQVGGPNGEDLLWEAMYENNKVKKMPKEPEFPPTWQTEACELLKVLASFPIEASPNAFRSGATIYGYNDWKLMVEHVLKARKLLERNGQ